MLNSISVVFKTHRMQIKLFFATFNLNCGLNAVSVRKPSEWMSNFWTVQLF